MFKRVYAGRVITQGLLGSVKYRIGYPASEVEYATALAAGGTIQISRLITSENEALRRASAVLRNYERDGLDCRVEVIQAVVDDNAYPVLWDSSKFKPSGRAVPNPAQFTLSPRMTREQIIIRWDAPERGLTDRISAANKPVNIGGNNFVDEDYDEDTEDRAAGLGEGA